VTKTIDFYWDLGSTNTYFALKLLRPLAARYNAQIRWHPFNLGHVFQSNRYVLMDESKAKLRNRRDDLMRWAKRYQLPFRMPDQFPIKTCRALKGAIAMRQWGQEDAFIEAIFAAYWENNVGTIGEYAVLRDIAADLGVDPVEFELASESPGVRAALIDSTNDALARGVFGAPSMIIEDSLYWGKDRMEFIETQLAANG
jgi:2-hydroxychromene-2-carboxylate isomerase